MTTTTTYTWQQRIELLRHRIKEDPNAAIAGYELNLRLMSTPASAGALLLKLAFVIEGAKGEAKTHKRKVALGSLHYAVSKEFEEASGLSSF
jgi:hypothetical protein